VLYIYKEKIINVSFVIQLPTTQLIHLQNTFTTKYIDTHINLNNTVTAFYDYRSIQKSITFTKDSITQTIEVPVYDDPYKEGNETFLFRPCMNVNRINYLEREVA